MTTYLSISIPSGVLSPLIAFSRSSRQRLLTSSPGDQIVFFFFHFSWYSYLRNWADCLF